MKVGVATTRANARRIQLPEVRDMADCSNHEKYQVRFRVVFRRDVGRERNFKGCSDNEFFKQGLSEQAQTCFASS